MCMSVRTTFRMNSVPMAVYILLDTCFNHDFIFAAIWMAFSRFIKYSCWNKNQAKFDTFSVLQNSELSNQLVFNVSFMAKYFSCSQLHVCRIANFDDATYYEKCQARRHLTHLLWSYECIVVFITVNGIRIVYCNMYILIHSIHL